MSLPTRTSPSSPLPLNPLVNALPVLVAFRKQVILTQPSVPKDEPGVVFEGQRRLLEYKLERESITQMVIEDISVLQVSSILVRFIGSSKLRAIS